MAHGTKDYGNIAPKQVTYQLTDMAELAVRLGAVNSIDRLGDLIYVDDFSSGLGAWETAVDGTGSAVVIDGNIFKFGGYSLKLTGGSDSGRYAQASLSVTFPEPSRMGFEHIISFSTDTDVIYFTHDLFYKTGYYRGYVKLDFTNDKICIWDGTSVWFDVATSLRIKEDIHLFHVLKIVTDFSTGKYVRFILDGIIYDVSQYSLFYQAGNYNPKLTFAIKITSVNLGNAIGYLDYVIITRNEP